MYDIQYQEEMDHGRDGIVYCGEVVSYADAERAAGGDTADTLRYEDEFLAELQAAEDAAALDAMEARGGPVFSPTHDCNDTIPF
jgi:hypothetical protein